MQAQKVAPVTASPLTGIKLPAGSKSDKRFLSVTSAKLLMETAAKKTGATLKNTEVLYLPADNSYTAAEFTAAAKETGWDVSPVAGENEYYWLQQNGRTVLMYFSVSKKEIDVYFAESNQPPAGNTTTQTQNDVQPQNNTPADLPPPPPQPEQQTQNPVQENTVGSTPAVNSGFKFSTTNFDDGWTSTVQEDWVEVTKSSIKVLLHYPKEGTIFPADPDPLVRTAWDILVAPRYSNLKNFRTTYISTYNRPILGMGYATENSTGKEVFVVFFNQFKTWIEFVTPDKNTFIQQFKIDPETIQWDTDSDKMNPLAGMTSYNKFAIGAADFKGKWTSDFTGIQQLYNVYTGNYAGMNINQSNEEFIFGSGGTYSWKLLVVNGMAGNAKFTEVKSSGKLSVPNNWQLQCSKIESGPKLFNAFWSCIKGARILNLLNAQYPGSGIYTQYGLAK